MGEGEPKAEGKDLRVVCFEAKEGEAAFDESIMKLMGVLQEQSRVMFVNDYNVLRMNHGNRWRHSARAEEPDTTMHHITAEMTVPFKDIVENDLSLIGRTLRPINEDMQRQFSQNMYAIVGAAAEKIGNVVSARETGSFAQSILEMFRKIELTVGRDGEISMPQLHINPTTYERLAEEMNSVPPDIQAEIDRVKEAKIREAHERESERKAKFRRAAR